MATLARKHASDDLLGRKSTVAHNTGLNGTFSWDDLNRATALAYTGFDGQENQSISQALGYDIAGNVTALTRESGQMNFGVDAINRIVQSSYTGAATLPQEVVNRTFALDPTGNRANDSLYGNGVTFANVLLENSTFVFTPTSDGTGSLAVRTKKEDSASEVFTYGPHQLLTSYSKNGETVEYKIDPFGRRIAKVVHRGAETFTQSFLYEGSSRRTLMGRAGNGDTYAYLNGQSPGEHLGHISSNGEVKAYVTDYANSVLNTSIAGPTKIFGAHGELLSGVPALAIDREPAGFGWQGLRFDPESNTWDNGPRQYDPYGAYFPMSDPIGFAGGTPNLHQSRGNNPLRYYDPSGFIWANIGGAIVGVLGTYIGAKLAGEEATFFDYVLGGAIGFIHPTAGPFVSGLYGFLTHSLNPPVTAPNADQPPQPIPADLRYFQEQFEKNYISDPLPELDPFAPIPQIRECGGKK